MRIKVVNYQNVQDILKAELPGVGFSHVAINARQLNLWQTFNSTEELPHPAASPSTINVSDYYGTVGVLSLTSITPAGIWQRYRESQSFTFEDADFTFDAATGQVTLGEPPASRLPLVTVGVVILVLVALGKKKKS